MTGSSPSDEQLSVTTTGEAAMPGSPSSERQPVDKSQVTLTLADFERLLCHVPNAWNAPTRAFWERMNEVSNATRRAARDAGTGEA